MLLSKMVNHYTGLNPGYKLLTEMGIIEKQGRGYVPTEKYAELFTTTHTYGRTRVYINKDARNFIRNKLLTIRPRKRAMLDRYIETGNYAQVGREYKVTSSCASCYVKRELSKMVRYAKLLAQEDSFNEVN